MIRKSRVRRIEKPLTATELEMMNVIWRLGPCSVLQVVEQLHQARVATRRLREARRNSDVVRPLPPLTRGRGDSTSSRGQESDKAPAVPTGA